MVGVMGWRWRGGGDCSVREPTQAALSRHPQWFCFFECPSVINMVVRFLNLDLVIGAVQIFFNQFLSLSHRPGTPREEVEAGGQLGSGSGEADC